jgi:hypothetical protein
MPSLSKTFDKKGAEKLYKEFFYQAEFILADKGKIAFIIENDEFFKECLGRIKEMQKFKITEEREVMQGKRMLKMIVMKKV